MSNQPQSKPAAVTDADRSLRAMPVQQMSFHISVDFPKKPGSSGIRHTPCDQNRPGYYLSFLPEIRHFSVEFRDPLRAENNVITLVHEQHVRSWTPRKE